jgi:hypothetical protein
MKADRFADRLLTLRFEWRRAFGLPGLAGVLMLGAAAITYAAIAGVESDTRAMLAPRPRSTRCPRSFRLLRKARKTSRRSSSRRATAI